MVVHKCLLLVKVKRNCNLVRPGRAVHKLEIEVKVTFDPAKNLDDLSKSELLDRVRILTETVHQLTDFVENGSLPLHRVDRDGKIIWANQAELDGLGYTKDEYFGQSVVKFHADGDVIADILTRLTNNETLRNYEARLIHKNGSIRDVLINSSVFRENGEFIHTRCFTRDVTDQKRIARINETAKQHAESANFAKSAFLANMSHEVRTPVAAILGFSELIAAPDLSPEDRASFTKAIRRNGQLLTNIINDILDISKVEAGQLSVDIHETSVQENLNDVLEILKVRAAEKNIGFTVSYSETVPKTIYTDPLRLRQILFNVVGNAIKFTEKGEVSLRVDLRETSGAVSQLIFEVSDTGIGISPIDAEKLFHPFSQADLSNTRRFGGAGLGLALSRGLANLLGGDVCLARSEKDLGSTFIVSIDRGPLPLIEYVPMDNSGIAISEAQPALLEGLRVLIVEDSEDNRIIISRLLKKYGALVESCDDGKAGVEAAMSNRFDAVLMDIQMPIMDGYEAVSELRRRGYGKPVIALTAHALREERLYCLDAGFDEHISKPVDKLVLAKLIDRLCR